MTWRAFTCRTCTPRCTLLPPAWASRSKTCGPWIFPIANARTKLRIASRSSARALAALTPPPQYVTLAQAAARVHALWPDLVCAIIEQESAWNPWALRYEPSFYAKYIAPRMATGAITSATEAHTRAFSWGLMQVMGQVAREHGFTGVSLAALCEPATALDVGCRVFAAKLAA